MRAEVLSAKENELELKLQDEDISVMYIIQHELLKEKSVDFAGVILKHPLTREYFIRVVTRKRDPFEVIQEASAKASEVMKELSGAIRPTLRK
ncbi:MAG TPA: RpoL/Rpb11 RNA polymerase subunit family protein [Nitrososphaeraceae archaeon]|jgi:DNA-directed RNA polymerase subunit L|nr:RpoL/Rpb11 RNA polymerase subunit family protein [Nitrososphaeraceae archaeon]